METSMQEGNGNSLIKIVRIAGMLFIGMAAGPGMLEKPRMVQFVPMKDGRGSPSTKCRDHAKR
jgi:hypothetical protein